MDFRHVLRARRLELGMRQQDLASIVGVHKSAISQWERGETSPTYKMSLKVAKALGMNARDLFYPLEEVEEQRGQQKCPLKTDTP